MSSVHTFNPYDDELISRYLNKKITETDGVAAASEINEVNICRHEPGEIPGLARIPSTHTWHVISRVEKLKGRCGRTKRSTKTGYWKVTGKPCVVKDVDCKTIGFKNFLVFQEKTQPSSSSSSSSANHQKKYIWTIHEFHSFIQHPNKDDFVLCKLMKKTRTPRANTVADTIPLATDLPPIVTSEPITAPSQTQNDSISVEDYGGDYFDGLEDYFPQFQSTDCFDQSQCLLDETMQDLELGEFWDMGND